MPLGSLGLWRGRVAFGSSIAFATATWLSCSAPDGSGLFQPFDPEAGAASGGEGGAASEGNGGSGPAVAAGGTSAGADAEGQGGNLPLAGASGSGGSSIVVNAGDAGPSPPAAGSSDAGIERDAGPSGPPPVTCEPSDEVCDGLDNDCDEAVDSGGACPAGCTGFTLDEHAYMFCDEGVNRAVALASCAEEAMKLVWIESPEENAALVERVAALAASDDELLVHIGASDQGGENEWSWVGNDAAFDGFQFWQGNATGDPVDGAYANWASGEPNNTGNEDCGAMSVTGSATRDPGQWDDRLCATEQPFLCEDP